MNQPQPIDGLHTIDVRSHDDVDISDDELRQVFRGILEHAKLPLGTYILKIKQKVETRKGRSIAFNHNSKDIVYLFWFTAHNVTDTTACSFRGVLSVAHNAIKDGLVDELNQAAVSYFTTNPLTTPEESTMNKRREAHIGYDLVVRKNHRKVQVALPGRLTRMLRELLVSTQLPFGHYEYRVYEVMTATDLGSSRHAVTVEKTLMRGTIRVVFKLSKNQNDTFIGELVLPGKAIVPDLYTKFCAAAEKLTQDRWGDNEAVEKPGEATEATTETQPLLEPAPRATSTEVSTPRPDYPPSASETPPQKLSVLATIEHVIACLTEHGTPLLHQIGTLNAGYTAELDVFQRELGERYARLRQPLEEQLALIQAEVEELQRWRSEAIRLKLTS